MAAVGTAVSGSRRVATLSCGRGARWHSAHPGRRAPRSQRQPRCGAIDAGSRKTASELGAFPAAVLHVVSAGRVCHGVRDRPRIERSAVRIVGAEVRCRMAIVGVRTAIVPALDHGFGICRVTGLHRGRAISAWAAIRVQGAIAANVTHIRVVVRGRATANAGRPRSAIRVGKALVVRTAAN